MDFDWLADPTAWVGLGTLVVLEIILGIDNLVFIAILADKLPPEQRERARLLGLSLALLMRLGLLAAMSWIVTLERPLFHILDSGISGRDIIMLSGGLFLIFKATVELHEKLEGGAGDREGHRAQAVFWQVIAQIVVLDAIFSLDSVITAVGMVQHLTVMMIAVVIAIGVMMLSSRPLMSFVSRHPTVVILCLGFLLMIGFSLVVEGFGFHIPKGYLYAAIGFAILIEAFNQLARHGYRRRVSTMDLRDRTASAVLRLLGGGRPGPHSPEEMAALASTAETAALFAPEERTMIERVMRLGERSVRSIMVPRPDVDWLDAEDPPETVLDEVRSSGHSRYPVARGDLDRLLGIVGAKDLLEQQRAGRPLDLASLVREPLYVTDSASVLKLLENFRVSGVHLAVVVDEHGSFEGLVTPADILVAIAGALPEGEAERPAIVRQEDGSWLLDGSLTIDEAEAALNLRGLGGDGDYVTLAGFVLHGLGRVPEISDTLRWQGWTFEVVALEGRRIERVKATPPGVQGSAQGSAK